MTRLSIPAALLGCGLALAACSNSATSDSTERDASGEVVDGGEVGVFRLQQGDCIAEATEQDVLDSLPVVPCGEPHQLEIYHVFDLADGDWPGEQAVSDRAVEGCLAAFAGFVGVPFDQSAYDATPLMPSEQSWEQIDDREVLCALFEFDGTLKTGSARGTAR